MKVVNAARYCGFSFSGLMFVDCRLASGGKEGRWPGKNIYGLRLSRGDTGGMDIQAFIVNIMI